MNPLDILETNGTIQVGTNATANPTNLEMNDFALGIANKDYPAQTPRLWNLTYTALGLERKNIRTFGNPDNAKEIFLGLKNDERYIGGDVGVGFKDQVLDLLDEVDPIAKQMGAINVVVKKDGKLIGYNTDGHGYADSLEQLFSAQGKEIKNSTVMLLGAGGTTNAIAFALAERGAALIILNRTESKAIALADRINDYFHSKIAVGGPRELISKYIQSVQAVVSIIDDPNSPLDKLNALGPITLPITEEIIKINSEAAKEILSSAPADLIISDVMLRNADTATISEAKALGFLTLDGIPMVINQAVEAFALVNEQLLKENGISKDRVSEIMHNLS